MSAELASWLAEHIRAWQPRRVLAELRGKRFLVVMFSAMLVESALADVHTLASNGLKAMALPYAQRAGYQAGWAP